MNDRGSITLWLLGLVLFLFGLGGIVLDLWRVLGERAELAVLVASAAVAATSAVDESSLRAGDGIVLVEADARRRALVVLAADPPLRSAVTVAGPTATVTAEREASLTLLRVLVPDDRPVLVRVTSSATAEFRP